MTAESMPYIRQELFTTLPIYNKIDHCIEGGDTIKRNTTLYLPKPNADDTSTANATRYDQYLTRAVFYGVTGRTLSGLLGTLFLREPTIQLPTGLELLLESANGIELGLSQLARRAASKTISHGRAGIFTDFPTVDSPVTVAQKGGVLTPIIRVYNPQDIINWKVGFRNGRKILRMVVLHELIDASLNDFSGMTPTVQLHAYRILSLQDDVYTVQYWVQGEDLSYISIPTDSTGSPFNEIPFTFIGSENNDELIDVPPLAAMADLNIGHYRNSADYQESCFMVGQPTTILAGLTTSWIKDVFEDKPIVLGSRQAVPMPTGGSAMLLQAAPNTMPFESMQALERQMIALGAQIVQQRSVQRTATESNNEEAADTSILGACANNVSDAFRTALKFACRFAGENEAEIDFRINTNLGYVTMTPQEQVQMVANWNAGVIGWSEVRTQFRQAGIATDDDEAVKQEHELQAQLDHQKNLDTLAATAAFKGHKSAVTM
jgi:hypothetical protein